MSKISKKLFSISCVAILFSLNACGNSLDINAPVMPQNQQGIQAQSWFSSGKGTIPDNGDINIKLDNLVLSRRSFNNSNAKFYIDGQEAFPAMERLIDSATSSLYIEMFIFHDDIAGRRIAEKLAAKRRQGVEVKVLIDSIGIKNPKSKDKRIRDFLISQGIDIQIYNSSYIGATGINITHRKLLIADGQHAITGGMNFGDEYENVWHDSMTEIHGEAAQAMQQEFIINWQKAGGKAPQQVQRLQQGQTFGNNPVRVVVTSAFESKKRYQIRDSLFALIDSAKTRIRMAGAYFSDDDLIKKLVNAKKRGVNVEIIMPKKGDSKIYNVLNLGTAKTFIKNGVTVYFYQPRFSHVKATLIDDVAVVGSANPDARSFRENQELNLIVEDQAFVSDLDNRLFNRDIAQSTVATLDDVKVGLFRKIKIGFLELFDYYL